MRTLEQCKTEIFRRSQQRLQKRRHILAGCIPVVLCAALCAAAFLPDTRSVNNSAPPNSSGSLSGDHFYGDSLVCSYTLAEIQATGSAPAHYQQVTDKVAVTKIFCAIHGLFDDAEPPPEANDGNGSVLDKELAGAAGYSITLSTAEGAKTIYTLSGYVLINETTGQQQVLTQAQLSQLKKDLELPQ